MLPHQGRVKTSSIVGMSHDRAAMSSRHRRTRASRRAISNSDQVFAALHRIPNVGFAICDDQLRFESINRALASMNGVPVKDHLGKTVRDVLGVAAEKIEHIFKSVFHTGEPRLNVEICVELPTRNEVGYWIESYFPLKDVAGEVKQVAVLVVEVTGEKKLEESLRSVAGKLLRSQDFEQRRVARELHDSINQYHAALKMNLGLLGQCDNGEKRAELLSKSTELLDQCIEETRTICHLLHPPLLDLVGFVGATRQYVRGFAERSGIRVKLKIPPRLKRLPESVEISLFRVLQESLTNAYRHSQTSLITIQLARNSDRVVLGVRDYGCGMPSEQLQQLQESQTSAGVGLASIRERIHDLGGQFEIRSGKAGTLVIVALPVSESA
jgi:signal transduction histidine kinase